MPDDSPEHSTKHPHDPSAIHQSATHSSTASDNEGSEKPVREKLRKATINSGATGTQSQTSAPDPNASASDADDEASGDRMDGRPRVKLARKRSRDDMDHSDDINDDNVHNHSFNRHVRKRSRDTDSDEVENDSPHGKQSSTSSDSVDPRPGTPDEQMTTQVLEQHLTSPKGKRNREQFLKDDEESEVQTLDAVAMKPADEQDIAAGGAKPREGHEERDAKRQRDGASTALKPDSVKEVTPMVRAITCLVSVLTSPAVCQKWLRKRLLHIPLCISPGQQDNDQTPNLQSGIRGLLL
jgi:Ran-binding protein 3